MSKRILCLTTAILLIMSLLVGCGSEKKTETAEKKPPNPVTRTIERSENSFGARYNFTLSTISNDLAEDAGNLGVGPDNTKWETISEGLVDDNGVKYSSYCNREGKVTYTAAVESNSGMVMNIGCGCQSSKFKDEAYHSSFIRLAATISIHAGGYQEDDLSYFMLLFKELLDGTDSTLYYNSTLYYKSVDKETTVLMCVPCDDRYIGDKNYKEYTGYDIYDAE